MIKRASLVAQMVKNVPTMRETQFQSLGGEDPPEKGMATHSSILAWMENPMDRGAWWAIAHGVTKSQTQLSMSLLIFSYIYMPSVFLLW